MMKELSKYVLLSAYNLINYCNNNYCWACVKAFIFQVLYLYYKRIMNQYRFSNFQSPFDTELLVCALSRCWSVVELGGPAGPDGFPASPSLSL